MAPEPGCTRIRQSRSSAPCPVRRAGRRRRNRVPAEPSPRSTVARRAPIVVPERRDYGDVKAEALGLFPGDAIRAACATLDHHRALGQRFQIARIRSRSVYSREPQNRATTGRRSCRRPRPLAQLHALVHQDLLPESTLALGSENPDALDQITLAQTVGATLGLYASQVEGNSRRTARRTGRLTDNQETTNRNALVRVCELRWLREPSSGEGPNDRLMPLSCLCSVLICCHRNRFLSRPLGSCSLASGKSEGHPARAPSEARGRAKPLRGTVPELRCLQVSEPQKKGPRATALAEAPRPTTRALREND